MYVGRIMHTDLVTVSPDMPLTEARELIEQKEIEHLLVVNREGKLTGLVSDRDIRLNWASAATTLSSHELNYLLNKVTMSMIMRKKVVTVTPDTTIERAALIIKEKKIGSLPVMENGKLLGIVTRTDVMEILLDAIGVGEDARRFEVIFRDKVGVLAKVTQVLSDGGINIQSTMSYPLKSYPGIHLLLIRVSIEDLDSAIQSLKDEGFAVLTKYEPDLMPFIATI